MIFAQKPKAMNTFPINPIPTSAATVPAVAAPQSQVHSGEGLATIPDITKIRELAEQIRQRCSHLPGQPQAANFQVVQAEELTKKLKEVAERLQEAVKPFSLGDVKGQLEQVASRLGLKFETQHSAQTQTYSFFIISDAFFSEVCCQGSGTVTTVRLVQASSQEESEVLCKHLCNHNYVQFECHLQALADFYKQASSQADFNGMYGAMVAIEKEVMNICDKSPQMAVREMIMSNPLGHVTPRKAGLSQYLTIFIHPYEVLKNPALSKPSGGVVLSKQEVSLDLGVAVKMKMEKSYQVNRLSLIPNLFDFNSAHFCELTEQNSLPLSLNFVLELSKPVPTCGLVLDKLYEIVFKGSNEQRVVPTGRHVNQLVAQARATKEQRDSFSEKTRIVCLPEQRHFYLMPSELQSGDQSHDNAYPSSVCGAMLSKVVFCHPVHLFSIIPLLRKQLMYNTLLDSCLGRSSKGVPPAISESEFIFELSTMPPELITVTMDTESMLNSGNQDNTLVIEFAVPDRTPTKLHVQIKVGTSGSSIEQPQLADITGRCLSIPVALNAALRRPSQLLGAHAAAALKAYQMSVEEFNRELGSLAEEGVSMGGVLGAGNDATEPFLGMKRKRPEL